MTLKTLVTGVAAVAVVAAAAGGVTSIASSASPTTPAIQPVVFGVPMPLDPAPSLAGPLMQTLNGLVAPGSYSGSRGTYIEGGLGRITSIGADAKYNAKAQQGYFPLTFVVSDIDEQGNTATANISATAANGAVAPVTPLTFVQGPSPSGWQLSRQSVQSLLASFSS